MSQVGASCAFYCWCMICGVKVGRTSFAHVEQWENAARTPGRWTEASLLIQGPAWGDWGPGPKSMAIPNETVMLYPANVGWQRLDVSRTFDKKKIMIQIEQDDEENENRGADTDSRWYFVIHSACCDIASMVMETSPRASIRNIGDLWMTLDRRCRYTQYLSRDGYSPQLPLIPFKRPGKPIECGLEGYCIPQRVYDEPHGYLVAAHIVQWWNADPLHIPDITASLMACLQQHESTGTTSQEFKRRFALLPQEVKDEILTDLIDTSLSLQCTYTISQNYWKQMFLEIPFLWDLDRTVIDKLPDACDGYEWDWEKITRQLMSRVGFVEVEGHGWSDVCPVTWSYNTVGLDAPAGLTNRRRIWQLLEDMYPNDVGYEQVGLNDPYSEDED